MAKVRSAFLPSSRVALSILSVIFGSSCSEDDDGYHKTMVFAERYCGLPKQAKWVLDSQLLAAEKYKVRIQCVGGGAD